VDGKYDGGGGGYDMCVEKTPLGVLDVDLKT
jgi:hypothetical protein